MKFLVSDKVKCKLSWYWSEGLKCLWHKILYHVVWKSFQNDEEWRLFYCDSTLACRVIQDFDSCKLMTCDVTFVDSAKFHFTEPLHTVRFEITVNWDFIHHITASKKHQHRKSPCTLPSRSVINFALVVHSVGVGEYGHSTAQATKSAITVK